MEATAVVFERPSAAYGLVAEVRRLAGAELWPSMRVGRVRYSAVAFLPTELWDLGWVEELATRYGGTVLGRRIVAEAMIAGVGAIQVECPRRLRPTVHALIERALATDDRVKMSESSAVAATALLEAVRFRLAHRGLRLSIAVEPALEPTGELVVWRVEEASVA